MFVSYTRRYTRNGMEASPRFTSHSSVEPVPSRALGTHNISGHAFVTASVLLLVEEALVGVALPLPALELALLNLDTLGDLGIVEIAATTELVVVARVPVQNDILDVPENSGAPVAPVSSEDTAYLLVGVLTVDLVSVFDVLLPEEIAHLPNPLFKVGGGLRTELSLQGLDNSLPSRRESRGC